MRFDYFREGAGHPDDFALAYPRSFDPKASNPGRYSAMDSWSDSVLRFAPRDDLLSDRTLENSVVPAAGVTGAARPSTVPASATKNPLIHQITAAAGSVIEGIQFSVVKQQPQLLTSALATTASVKLLGSLKPYVAVHSNTATGFEAEKASEQVIGQVHDAVRA